MSINKIWDGNLSAGGYAPDGFYTINATLLDQAGNQANYLVGNITVDNTAPIVTINSLVTNDTTPLLNGTVNENAAIIIVNVNGTNYAATNNGDGTWTLGDNNITSLVDAVYNVTVQAIDSVNNTGVDATINELTIDASAPTTNDDYSAKDSVWQTSDQTITLTPNCNVAGCAWTKYCTGGACDVSAGTTYTDPVNFTTEGTTIFRYASLDLAGNLQSTVQRTVMVDKSVPTTNDDAPTGWQTSNFNINLTLNDSVSGINATYYCIDSANTCTPNVTFTAPVTISTDGSQYFRYFSIDNAGNNQTVIFKSIQLDKIAPTITDNYAYNGTWINSDQFVTLSPSDATSGLNVVKYCTGIGCDPSTGTNLTAPYQFTYNSDQNTTVRYQAWDNASLASTVGEYIVKMDKSAPTVNAGTSKVTNVQLNQDATVDANISGVQTYSWTKVSGPGTLTFGTSNAEDTTIQADTEGVYVLRLNVTDNANNSAFSDINFTWDTSKPVFSNLANQIVIKNYPFSYDIDANDSLSGNIIYSINDTSNFNINPASGIMTNVTAMNTLGIQYLNVTISDNAGNTNSGVISITVTANGTLTGVINDSDNNLYGTLIEVKQNNMLISSATSDQNGFYVITLPGGSYNISVIKTGFNIGQSNVTVSADSSSEMNMTLTPSTSSAFIGGTVFDNAYATVNNADVYIYDHSNSNLIQVVKSDASGNYRVNGLITTNTYDLNSTKIPTYNSTFAGQMNVVVPGTGKDIVIQP